MSDKETLTFISTGSNQMIVANWDWVQRTFPADPEPAESTRTADATTPTEIKANKEIKESGALEATPATAPTAMTQAQDATTVLKPTPPSPTPAHEAHPPLEANEETKAVDGTKAVDVHEPAIKAPVEAAVAHVAHCADPAMSATPADPLNEANPAIPANEGRQAKVAPAHTATRVQNPEVTEPLHTDAPMTESHSEPEPESERDPMRETVNPKLSTDPVPPSDVMTATHDRSPTSERMVLTVENDGESFFATPLADATPVKQDRKSVV